MTIERWIDNKDDRRRGQRLTLALSSRVVHTGLVSGLPTSLPSPLTRSIERGEEWKSGKLCERRERREGRGSIVPNRDG